VLRAGPFSDPRIQTIINNRFVNFYFDLQNHAVVGDAQAKRFVGAVKRNLTGSRVPTPPVLICTPDGELIAEISNYASAAKMLPDLRRVIARHPGSQEPSPAEREDPLLHAEVLGLLGHLRRAEDIFREQRDAPGTALRRARLLRWLGQPDPARRALAAAKDGSGRWHREAAWQAWEAEDFQQALNLLEAMPEGERDDEDRYLSGLALWASGQREQAKRTWKDLIDSGRQGPWVYRADWAWVATGCGRSRLGRHGYMGSTHPDLP